MKRLFLVLLAVCVVCAAVLCPVAEAKTVVIVQTPGVAVAPQVSAAPAPTVEYFAPQPVAPVVTYTRTYTAYTAPVGVMVSVGPSAAQRHAARRAAYHTRRAAYWASRS